MPLVRFELRNEYGLGQPDIYRQVDREDPKAVLDAAAVAGLVGILRQLGDLSEYCFFRSSLFLLCCIYFSALVEYRVFEEYCFFRSSCLYFKKAH